MTTYRISAPDGKTYQIDGPAGATDEQVRAEVIRQNPHLAAPTHPPLTREQLIAQIPTDIPGYTPPVRKPQPVAQKPGVLAQLAKNVIAAGETGRSLATGTVAGVVAPWAGVIGELGGKAIEKAGLMPKDQRALSAEEIANAVSNKLTYQPVTQEARNALNTIGTVTAPLVGAFPELNRLAEATAAARANGPLVEQAVTAAKADKAAKLQAKVDASYANAATIDAAKLAQQHGIAINPVTANPTKGNKVKSVVAGTATMDPYFAQQNAPKWTDLVKKDMGLDTKTQLTAQTYENAVKDAAKPYDAVKTVVMKPTEQTMADIDGLRVGMTIGGEESTRAVDKLIGSAKEILSAGRTGAEVLGDIRQLRRNATQIYQSQKAGMAPDPSKIAVADTSVKMAGILEDMIEANTKSADTLQGIQKARQRMAQIYDFERATDPITGTIDPQEFAKMLRDGKQMTGIGADIGKIAGTFPGVAVVKPGEPPLTPSLQRGGVGGVIGAAIGGAVGGPVGAATGMGLGGTAGAAVRPTMARRFGTPEYQAKHAVPADYRPAPTPPEVQPIPQSRAIVPYRIPTEVLMPGEGPYKPNFVFSRSRGQVSPDMPESTNLLAAPSAQGTLNALRSEDVRRAQMSRALGEQSDLRQAAAEAASRKPTSGEVILNFDPVTGRLREASQGIKGATPETFSNFGAALETASNKVAGGQRFNLTAAEKVAWDRTRVDLAEVSPGFTALSDKAVAEKMMDRGWVAQAVVKAREKAAAFEQIAARAADERARQTALVNRERMMDLAEQMEESLSKPRPVSTGGQGPKTRAHQQNALRESETTNNLRGRQ